MIVEKPLRLLRELGLTEYEARTYTALVSNGPSTAGELSGIANVPYSRIYDILSKLERKGWVEVQSSRPTKYRGKPPAEVVRILKTEQEQRLKELGNGVVKELEPLYEQKAETKRPDVWVIRGGRNLLTKIWEMLARVQIETLISLPSLSNEIVKLGSFLPALQAKNINVRILVTEKPKLRSALPTNIEIKTRKPLFGGGVIIDGKEVLLVLGNEEEIVGIWSDEIGLARFAKEYFEYLWRDSKHVK
ncbi:MAG TPA: TrmB family transcriptional regulator [Hadesarchaea archaeon]|nr:TrmB family transcriptional regulator [Hadesarchaea archaeon]